MRLALYRGRAVKVLHKTSHGITYCLERRCDETTGHEPQTVRVVAMTNELRTQAATQKRPRPFVDPMRQWVANAER